MPLLATYFPTLVDTQNVSAIRQKQRHDYITHVKSTNGYYKNKSLFFIFKISILQKPSPSIKPSTHLDLANFNTNCPY
jgi:hypothetical protein